MEWPAGRRRRLRDLAFRPRPMTPARPEADSPDRSSGANRPAPRAFHSAHNDRMARASPPCSLTLHSIIGGKPLGLSHAPKDRQEDAHLVLDLRLVHDGASYHLPQYLTEALTDPLYGH